MIKNINGLKIYYEVVGSGKPLLLLHGWGNSSETMRPIAILAKEYGYKVFSIDLPGFGFSALPPSPWEVRDYVEFIVKFLDEFNIKKADIISHSFGGRITIMLSAIYPERIGRIALVASAGIKPNHNLVYYFSIYTYKAVKTILSLFYGKNINKALLEKIGSNDFRNAGDLRGTFIKVINEDLKQYLPKIKAEALLIWGDQDKETPVSDGYIMERLIPKAKLKVIKDGGHHCFIDHKEEFNLIILSSFLER